MTDEFLKHQAQFASNVRFRLADDDVIQIGLAVTRFMDFLRERGVMPTENHARNLHMDLGACHSNGCPLDFEGLNAMELTPFVDDCVGIGIHLDRNTGKLTDGYRPRCAKGRIITVN